ncbi:MAG: AbrB family transcriptional regulator [Clostridiales bacterium GWC2_40_7]|nr:MAG: AbrB family transcriptional regulator [Clostridiales bacterium GWC2_40_7]
MSVVSEMERKVTRIGNSLGVTFPNEVLKKVNIAQGDVVTIDVKDGEIVLRKSRKINLPQGISPDFFDILNETMTEYGDTIKGLRDK